MLTCPKVKQVKDSSSEYSPYAAEEAWAEDVAQSEPTPPTGKSSNWLFILVCPNT